VADCRQVAEPSVYHGGQTGWVRQSEDRMAIDGDFFDVKRLIEQRC
jgi:hypothetical protein